MPLRPAEIDADGCFATGSRHQLWMQARTAKEGDGVKTFSGDYVAYTFGKEPSDALRQAIRNSAAQAEPGLAMAPIVMTDDETEQVLISTIYTIMKLGRPCSPHKEGTA